MYHRQQGQGGIFLPLPQFPQTPGYGGGYGGGAGSFDNRLDRVERQIQRLDRRVERLERQVERIQRQLGY
jgi:hypothetical protein